MPISTLGASPGNNPYVTSQQIQAIGQYVYNKLKPKYGSVEAESIQQSWINYADAHYQNASSIGQLYLAWWLSASHLTQSLATDIAQAPQAAGAADQALANSTPALNPVNDVIGGFNLSNTVERIGIILLGIVLVGVGIAKATGVDQFNLVSQAKKVLK